MSEIVNLYLGKRLRSRRKLLGLTQAELGAICGVRFQQIQKYESATNHMSAAMLWRLAASLGVSVQYFYEGLELQATPPAVAIRDSTGSPTFEPASYAMGSA